MNMADMAAQFEAEIADFMAGREADQRIRDNDALRAKLEAEPEAKQPRRHWGIRERREVFAEKAERKAQIEMSRNGLKYRNSKGVAGRKRTDGMDQHGECISWTPEKIREIYGV